MPSDVLEPELDLKQIDSLIEDSALDQMQKVRVRSVLSGKEPNRDDFWEALGSIPKDKKTAGNILRIDQMMGFSKEKPEPVAPAEVKPPPTFLESLKSKLVKPQPNLKIPESKPFKSLKGFDIGPAAEPPPSVSMPKMMPSHGPGVQPPTSEVQGQEPPPSSAGLRPGTRVQMTVQAPALLRPPQPGEQAKLDVLSRTTAPFSPYGGRGGGPAAPQGPPLVQPQEMPMPSSWPITIPSPYGGGDIPIADVPYSVNVPGVGSLPYGRAYEAVAGPGTIAGEVPNVSDMVGPGGFNRDALMALAQNPAVDLGAFTDDPLAKGLLRGVSAMTSPQNALLLASTAGLGEIAFPISQISKGIEQVVANKSFHRLMSAAFTADMLRSYPEQFKAMSDAADAGDVDRVKEIFGSMAIAGLFTGMAFTQARFGSEHPSIVPPALREGISNLGKRIDDWSARVKAKGRGEAPPAQPPPQVEAPAAQIEPEVPAERSPMEKYQKFFQARLGQLIDRGMPGDEAIGRAKAETNMRMMAEARGEIQPTQPPPELPKPPPTDEGGVPAEIPPPEEPPKRQMIPAPPLPGTVPPPVSQAPAPTIQVPPIPPERIVQLPEATGWHGGNVDREATGLGFHYAENKQTADIFARGHKGVTTEATLPAGNYVKITDHGGTHDDALFVTKSLVADGILPESSIDEQASRVYARQQELESSGQKYLEAWQQANLEELARLRDELVKRGIDGFVYENAILEEGKGQVRIVFNKPGSVAPPEAEEVPPPTTQAADVPRGTKGERYVPVQAADGTFQIQDSQTGDVGGKFPSAEAAQATIEKLNALEPKAAIESKPPIEAPAGPPTATGITPPAKPKRRFVSIINGEPDLLNHIEELGGIRMPTTESRTTGNYDGWDETIKGEAEFLKRKDSGLAPDDLRQQLNTMGYNFETTSQLYDAIQKEMGSRGLRKSQAKADAERVKAGQDFDKAVFADKGRTKSQKGADPVPISVIKVGDKFNVLGEEFTAVEVHENGDVVVEDGRTFPRQLIESPKPLEPGEAPPPTHIYPDKGTFKPAPETDTSFEFGEAGPPPQVEKVTSPEPPIEGERKTIRLYRGQGVAGEAKPQLPEWITQGLQESGALAAQGRWWTDDPEIAKWYRKEAGDKGEIVFIDVPADEAQGYRVTGLPEAKRFSLDPEHEFFLPESFKGKGERAAEADIPPGEVIEPRPKATPEEEAAARESNAEALRKIRGEAPAETVAGPPPEVGQVKIDRIAAEAPPAGTRAMPEAASLTSAEPAKPEEAAPPPTLQEISEGFAKAGEESKKAAAQDLIDKLGLKAAGNFKSAERGTVKVGDLVAHMLDDDLPYRVIEFQKGKKGEANRLRIEQGDHRMWVHEFELQQLPEEFATMLEPKAAPSPQILGILNLAADTRAQLRSVDVDRVMQEASDQKVLPEFKEYLLQKPNEFKDPNTANEIRRWEPPPPESGPPPTTEAPTKHYIGGVIPENPRLPIFTTTERTGAEWYAAERGTGGQVHEVQVTSEHPFELLSESDVKKLLPILDEAGIEYDFKPSTPENKGWSIQIPEVAKFSPYEGDNPLDVAYIPAVREALIKHGYDSIKADDVLENSEIPTTVLIKDVSQMKRVSTPTETPSSLSLTEPPTQTNPVDPTTIADFNEQAAAAQQAGRGEAANEVAGRAGMMGGLAPSDVTWSMEGSPLFGSSQKGLFDAGPPPKVEAPTEADLLSQAQEPPVLPKRGDNSVEARQGWRDLAKSLDGMMEQDMNSGTRAEAELAQRAASYLHDGGKHNEEAFTEFLRSKGIARINYDPNASIADLRRELKTAMDSGTTEGPPEVDDLFRTGPGAQTVGSQGETPSDIAQLTEAVKSATKGMKLDPANKISFAVQAAKNFEKKKDAISQGIAATRAVTASLWDWYRRGGITPWTNYKDMLGKYLGARQKSSWEAYQFAKASRKIPQIEQEAVVNWMEANGDRTVLQARADATDDKILKMGYQAALRLDPELQNLANNFRNYFDSMLEKGREAGLLDQSVLNYVNHIWKKENTFTKKIRAEINAGLLRENPDFAKKRIWQTYFEGEQVAKLAREAGQPGVEAVNKGIGYLITAYDQSFNEAIAARAFMRTLTGYKDENGNRVPGGVGKDGRPLVIMRGSGNPVPDPNAPDAYMVWPKSRPKIKKDAQGNLLEEPQNTLDYGIIEHPALRDWKWITKDTEGNPVYLQADMLIHPDIYQHLKNVLGRSAIRQNVGTTVLTGAGELKKLMLSLSLFHQAQESLHAGFHLVFPGSKHLPWKFNLPDIDLNDPVQMAGVQHGLMIHDHNALSMFHEGLSGAGLIGKVPFGIGTIANKYQDFLFQGYIPRLKMQLYKHALERNRKRYSSKLSDNQIQELTANQANAAFGELNYKMMGRNPTFQDVFRLMALAPDFLEARGRFVGQALKPFGKEQRLALLRGAIGLYGMARIGNYLVSGNPHWEPSKALSLVVGDKEYNLRTIAGDVIHMFKDPRSFVYHRLNPTTTRTVIEALTGRDQFGRERSLFTQLGDFFRTHVPIPIQGPLWKESDHKLMDSILTASGVGSYKARSDAERLAKNYVNQTSSKEELSPENLDKFKLQADIREKTRANPQEGIKAAREAIKNQKLSILEAQHVLNTATESDLERWVKRLPIEMAADVYSAGSKEEQRQLLPIIESKLNRFRESATLPEQERVLKKLVKVFPQLKNYKPQAPPEIPEEEESSAQPPPSVQEAQP